MHMLASTTFDIPGYEVIELKGLVRGIIVRSPTIAQGFLGGLKGIIGGRIGAYTQMCEQTRMQAYDDMERHAAVRPAVVAKIYRSEAVRLLSGNGSST